MEDDERSRVELEERVSVLEANLQDLIEQAAAYSGAGDDDRSSERIDQIEQELQMLKARLSQPR